MSRRVLTCLLILGAAGLPACGDDNSDSGSDNAGSQSQGGSGGATAGGSGGHGGQSAGGRSGSTSTSGGDATGTSSGPVQCGSTTCQAQGGGFIGMLAMPCCVDESTSTCGMSFMGAQCAVPSAGDPRCPTVQALGGISVPSCCTPDGMCGLDASMFGFGGCTELGAAAQQAGSMGMGGTFPAARRCDESPEDAGVSDAGA